VLGKGLLQDLEVFKVLVLHLGVHLDALHGEVAWGLVDTDAGGITQIQHPPKIESRTCAVSIGGTQTHIERSYMRFMP
jgi:hypothetical protein